MNKRKELLKLRSRIIDEVFKKRWEEVWFFPQYKRVKKISEVKGFLGTSPIVFLTMNPAYGTYPSKEDIFYYSNLKKNGFSNAHLTDVFKVKRRNRDFQDLISNKKLLFEAKRFLKEEFSILKPKLVVCLGLSRSYRRLYSDVLDSIGFPEERVETIPFFAPRFNDKKARARFRRAMQRLRKKYKFQ